VAEAYLSEQLPPPNPLTTIIQHAKTIFEKRVKSESTSTTESSELLISSLSTLSSTATYLETYLEIYPNSIPTQTTKDTEMADADPFEDEMILDEDDSLYQIPSSILLELLSAIPLILEQQLSVPLIPHALEAINDIAWTMTLRIPEWDQWRTIAEQLLQFAVPRLEGMTTLGEDTLSTFLGCIWAAAKSLPEKFSLDVDDVQNLESIYSHFPTAEIQAKIIGILGVAAQHESIEMNAHITKILMREIKSQFPLVVVEIMDAIIEIFADGEKSYDTPVFIQGGLLPQLKQLVPHLRKKIKSIDGRKETDLRERADEFFETFQQFLKYKENEAKHK